MSTNATVVYNLSLVAVRLQIGRPRLLTHPKATKRLQPGGSCFLASSRLQTGWKGYLSILGVLHACR